MSTVKTTNRTIEVSVINEDYMMPSNLNVQSVVFIPGDNKFGNDEVYIVENSQYATDPTKCFLNNEVGRKEPRVWIFNQRLRLGFVYNNGNFSVGAKVIFNIGELHFNNDSFSTQMKIKLNAEDEVF